MSSNEEILEEIKGLKRGGLVKDILLALIPLLVAGISIYFSNTTAQRQLELAEKQQTQTREIENAKLLEGFSQRILNGGKEAELAQIALDYIRLSDDQKSQLAKFFEQEAGGSDQPGSAPTLSTSQTRSIDSRFETLLDRIFAKERNVRAEAYTTTKNHLLNNYSNDLVAQMAAKVNSDPFNIKGRSNVLSILSMMPADKLRGSKDILVKLIEEIERKGVTNPSYAVGPQTKGWISEIRAKIA